MSFVRSSHKSSHKDFLKSQSLTKRRKKKRILRLWIFGFFFVLIILVSIWLISLPRIAIQKVIVIGNENITSGEIQNITDSILDSKYIGLFSKRNSFLYPKDTISELLKSTYPRIQDIEMSTESFQILNIKIKERTANAVWCAAIECFLTDQNGYIFAKHVDPRGADVTDSGTVPSLTIKSPSLPTLPVLHGGDEAVGSEPVGKNIFSIALYTDILDTISELKKINLNISEVFVYSRDEIVFQIANGTSSSKRSIIFSDRKSFESSIEDLKSSLKSSALSSQSNFEYIDVRFGNKIFYKLNGTSSPKTNASSSLKNTI